MSAFEAAVDAIYSDRNVTVPATLIDADSTMRPVRVKDGSNGEAVPGQGNSVGMLVTKPTFTIRNCDLNGTEQRIVVGGQAYRIKARGPRQRFTGVSAYETRLEVEKIP